jgi:anti-sigma factor RsiW
VPLRPPGVTPHACRRYEQHTKHCAHCKKALATTVKLQTAARVAACALLGVSVLGAWAAATAAAAAAAGTTAAVPRLVAAAASVNPAALLLAAAALAVAGQLLGRFKKGFFFVDFNRPA